jgi:hypothetical protein
MRGKLTAVSPSTIECIRMSFLKIFSTICVFLFIGIKTMILFNEVNGFMFLHHASRVRLIKGQRTSKLMLAQNKFTLTYLSVNSICRSLWLLDLKRRSAAAGLKRSWVGIPPGVQMSVSCECCMLPDRGLCEGLIARK